MTLKREMEAIQHAAQRQWDERTAPPQGPVHRHLAVWQVCTWRAGNERGGWRGAEKVCEETTAKLFLSLMKMKTKPPRKTWSHVIVKLLKTSDRENLKSSQREKTDCTEKQEWQQPHQRRGRSEDTGTTPLKHGRNKLSTSCYTPSKTLPEIQVK